MLQPYLSIDNLVSGYGTGAHKYTHLDSHLSKSRTETLSKRMKIILFHSVTTNWLNTK